MKELIDLKSAWDWVAGKWAKSFGCVMLVLLAFWFGIAWESKQITDDCKFIGAFRDGPQAYNCNQRIK